MGFAHCIRSRGPLPADWDGDRTGAAHGTGTGTATGAAYEDGNRGRLYPTSRFVGGGVSVASLCGTCAVDLSRPLRLLT